MWESINTTHQQQHMRRGGSGAFARHAFLAWVRDRAATLAGLTDSTMSRDDAWRFIVLGRNLERVDMTARLLSTRLGRRVGERGLGDDAARRARRTRRSCARTAAVSTAGARSGSCCSTGSSRVRCSTR